MDCDCKYYSPGIFKEGGCYISVAPPKGYKCKCEYSFLWSCTGTPWSCKNGFDYNDRKKEYCNGCKARQCCFGGTYDGKPYGGDCKGYV